MSFETNVLGLATKPTYWWPLDDDSGASAAAESEGTGNIATPADSGVTFGTADSPPGCAITQVATLNGDDGSYLYAADSVTPSTVAFTQAIWMKTAIGGAMGLFGLTDTQTGLPSAAYCRFLYQGEDWYVHGCPWGTLNAQSEGVENDGNWHFVVLTFDSSGNLTLWIDGTAVGSDSGDVSGGEGYWRIGAAPSLGYSGYRLLPGQVNQFTGELAHALIWDGYALTSDDIAALLAPTPPQPNWIARAMSY